MREKRVDVVTLSSAVKTGRLPDYGWVEILFRKSWFSVIKLYTACENFSIYLVFQSFYLKEGYGVVCQVYRGIKPCEGPIFFFMLLKF